MGRLVEDASAIAAKSNSSNARPGAGLPGVGNRPCRLNPRHRGMRAALMSGFWAVTGEVPIFAAARRAATSFTNLLRFMAKL
jgi:hypothetical protein